MAPRVDPVPSDEKLPAQADVVIIGGGIIGTSTALFLAQRGVATVLCEKGHIAGEQSSRNWGWCRKMARDPREIPLIIESLRLWERMNGTVEAETGFRTCGIMYLGDSAEALGNMEAWLEHAREYQLDTRRVAGVVTEKGRIACQSIVLAGGAWSRLFCGNLGIDLPQLKVLGSVMRTEPFEGGPEISATGGLFGYRKRMDGGYTVATLGVRTIDLVPDSFRLLPDYLPTVRMHWNKLRFRVGRRFVEEWHMPRRWELDAASPFEKVRVLD